MKRRDDNSEMRTRILRRRYLWKDAQGKVIETEEQMLRRVANAIAAAESKYGATKKQVKEFAEKFYRLMKAREFLPNSPTLMNAGRKNGMLSACFVLRVPDSIDGIFDAIKYTALIKRQVVVQVLTFHNCGLQEILLYPAVARLPGPLVS